ncbi:hypothetical protein SAMN06269250_2031 [Spirosoma fluviale]|uniref:Uncharacterized protein n=1 Tax=Spirosoma fluviale TaxID=1597977 RepID=A0A286FFX7_9BACT|nr:hypothetical protein SAMN06269250_2031 [Spirosoma fluviale]
MDSTAYINLKRLILVPNLYPSYDERKPEK